jgi:asparagine synthase (glutamine-hydrolysing)
MSRMCGISALLDRAASPGGVESLARMHAPIRHRGPDGEGFLVVDASDRALRLPSLHAAPTATRMRVGLAFRRLKILDLTEAAAQPMASPDGALWIVFNGEIYNFRELRGELQERGRVFRSTGDTEVALAAFEAWGEGCLDRLDGMWSMVVLDLRSRRLFGSRDRFGIKPLYWAARGPRLLLSSEIKQILAASGERARANRALVGRYLRGLRLPCLEETFFDGIRAVPPGTWFEVALDGGDVESPAFRRYWDLADHYCRDADRPPQDYAGALARFRSLLDGAVASHDVADVTVGSLLSGGLDSSTLVGLQSGITAARGRVLPTFSFGFPGAPPELDELRHVDAVLERYPLPSHRASYDAGWVAAHAPAVVRALEEPPLSLAALAQYRVFQLCREHGATVVLDGQGADEILAGYAYHQRALLADRLRKGRVREFLRHLRALERAHSVTALSIAADFLIRPAARRLAGQDGVVAPGFGAGGRSAEMEEALHERGRDPSLVNRRLHYDVRWGNVKVILDYGDKNAMAHSVEARVPYFDRKLVEFAFSLPDDYKVDGSQRKRILRDVARSLLPAAVTERPERLGFAVPDAPLITQMWPGMREVVADDGFMQSACFDRRKVASFVEGFDARRGRDRQGAWRLYALALWRRELGASIG